MYTCRKVFHVDQKKQFFTLEEKSPYTFPIKFLILAQKKQVFLTKIISKITRKYTFLNKQFLILCKNAKMFYSRCILNAALLLHILAKPNKLRAKRKLFALLISFDITFVCLYLSKVCFNQTLLTLKATKHYCILRLYFDLSNGCKLKHFRLG